MYYRRSELCCEFSVGKRNQWKGNTLRNDSCVRWEVFLSRKAVVHSWEAKASPMTKEFEKEVRKWLRQQSKRLVCCGFRRTGKAIGQVYQCCREINAFFSQVRVSRWMSIFLTTYWLALVQLAIQIGTRSKLGFYTSNLQAYLRCWADYLIRSARNLKITRDKVYLSQKCSRFKKSSMEHNLITTHLQVKRIQTYTHGGGK
jgi:hypothetical protein